MQKERNKRANIMIMTSLSLAMAWVVVGMCEGSVMVCG